MLATVSSPLINMRITHGTIAHFPPKFIQIWNQFVRCRFVITLLCTFEHMNDNMLHIDIVSVSVRKLLCNLRLVNVYL